MSSTYRNPTPQIRIMWSGRPDSNRRTLLGKHADDWGFGILGRGTSRNAGDITVYQTRRVEDAGQGIRINGGTARPDPTGFGSIRAAHLDIVQSPNGIASTDEFRVALCRYRRSDDLPGRVCERSAAGQCRHLGRDDYRRAGGRPADGGAHGRSGIRLVAAGQPLVLTRRRRRVAPLVIRRPPHPRHCPRGRSRLAWRTPGCSP